MGVYSTQLIKIPRDRKASTSSLMILKKLYLALAVAPMPTGIITHYMRPINMFPRLVSKDFGQEVVFVST